MTEEQRHPQRSHDEEEDLVEAPAATETASAADTDIDDILDEIDEVLESNAEEFVKSFVQKGGE